MFKGIKVNNLLSYKKVLMILLFAMFFIPKNVFAYTITYNSTFGKFSNNTTTNVVEYDNNHNVISGTYEEPTYTNGIDSSNFITWYSEYDAKNRVDINEVSEDITVYAAYEKIVWRFDYTGSEQTLSLPIKVGLQLKVWGAQGGNGNDEYFGGYGGYSTGLFDFDENETIYIYIGGQGEKVIGKGTISNGGYNGGGNGHMSNMSHLTNAWSTGGGGATHIAIESGELKDLVDTKDSVCIVAGGGAGHAYFRAINRSVPNTGHGGGYIGAMGRSIYGGNDMSAPGGGQSATTGSYFGLGQSGSTESGGAGGGWYGGQIIPQYSSGGGSGYIGNTIEGTRHMTAYSGYDDAYISDDEATKTIATTNASENAIEDYAKLGNGYAQAELTRLNIRYINEFDGTDFTKDQYVGSLAQNLSITQRPGYEAHWYKDDEIWNFDEPVNFDTILEVKYTIITYNITYNITGGTVSGNPSSYTVEDLPITLNNPIPNQEGYIFTGWTGTNLTEKTRTVTIPTGSTGDREYTANFEKEKYTITYNLNGGELEQGVTNPEEYYIDSPDITLNNPSREGYTFIGWTGSNGTTPTNVIIAGGSTGNKTYTANYQIDRHTATFDSNLGTTAVPETITKDYNEALGTLPTTSRRGYIFEGWFTERDGGTQISSTTKMPAQEVRYYAHWTPITYIIHFNSNNGTGSMADETMTYGVSKALTENAFTRDGWTFAGWNTKADGSGTNYIDKQEIFNLTDIDGEEFTLFAKWTKDEYIITYNADGGQLENPKTTYSVDDEEFTLVQPTKEGYTFTGWTGTGVSNPTKNVVIPTGSTGNRDYTAHWTATVYTIEYINNVTGETVLVAGNPTSYTVEDSDITLNNASDYDTYHFYVGWTSDKDTESDLSDSYVIRTNQMKNLKIYAIYQTSPYTVSFDSDGGNDIDPISRQGTEDVGPLPTPIKEGYIFKGWFVNNKLIDQTFHSRVDVTAIAKWEKIPDPVEPTIINPKTGDNIMKYLVLLLVSIIGLGYTGYKFRLKTKKTQ